MLGDNKALTNWCLARLWTASCLLGILVLGLETAMCKFSERQLLLYHLTEKRLVLGVAPAYLLSIPALGSIAFFSCV